MVEEFALKFIKGRMLWWDVPRVNGIINFGNIISLLLYRKPPYQVELFIIPHTTSSFTRHKHPNVDVVEFGLTGDAALYINDTPSCSKQDVQNWLCGIQHTVPIHIKPTDWHSGEGYTPYAFLSIQHWLNDVNPTSVGLDWIGQPSSQEQEKLWAT